MDFSVKMDSMVRTIEEHAKNSAAYTGIRQFSDKVIQAIRKTPRHEFVSVSSERFAYDDSPLFIGCGQTISQPFIVALMCEVLDLKKSDRVLEIGSGCGYHAAVLSQLVKEVYTLEIVTELSLLAAKNLEVYSNVVSKNSNGYFGFKDKAPFNAISVAAASERIPPDLLSQLAVGGKMVIPLANPDGMGQSLTLIDKDSTGRIMSRALLPVVFVPFVSN